MSKDAEDMASLSPRELDAILANVWGTAARVNPMFLVRLNPDLAFQHLRGLINDCLAQGMMPNEISAYVVQELLGSSAGTLSCSSASGAPHNEQASS
jgi:hypothetical protein